jgi:integrase
VGEAPADRISKANGVQVTTAHRWVKEARRPGFLGGGLLERRERQEKAMSRDPGIYPRTKTNGKTVYDVVVSVPGPDGRRRKVWRRGIRTLKEARQVRTELLSSLDRGTFILPSRQSIGEFLSEWLDAIRATVRPSTHDSYSRLVKRYIVGEPGQAGGPRIGGTQLQRLTAPTLNALYADLLRGGRKNSEGALSPRTVRYVHAIIHKALSDAVRWGKVSRNVADLADPPKQRTPEMRTWAAPEVRRFLEYVLADRLYALWRLAVSAGLRRGELLALRWEDLDPKASRLSIRRTLITVRYKLLFSTPKTARGTRSVALDAVTLAALRDHRKRQAEEHLAWGPAYEDKGLIFCQEDGRPIHPDRISKMFQGHAKAAGLPRVRFHDLRHTAATLALQAGIHPKVVSERLGHSTVSLTLDTYTHAVPALQEEAAETIASVILEGGSA